MAGPGAIFREIHRLRIHAFNMQEHIDLAPRQLNARQAIVAKREEELKFGHEAVKKLKVAIHERDVTVKAEHQLIKKYEQQLNDITSKKEYDALKHEIANVQEKIRALEEETLASMLTLEEKTAALPALQEALDKAKAEIADFESSFRSRLADLTKEREDVAAKIAAEEVKIPETVRAHYNRLIKAMGHDALAAVEGANCAACYTEMTMQHKHDVMRQQFVLCRNCGRILYAKG